MEHKDDKAKILDALGGKKGLLDSGLPAVLFLIVFNIFDEPINRVISIGTFVYVFLGFMVYLRCHVGKCTFAHVSSANVLIDENIFIVL
mgnify:CR=1 FL=1